VLEHVDDPGALLRVLRRQVGAGAPAFLSTVANMEAEDHVYLFHDADDIRALVTANGFTVDVDHPLELAGSETMIPKPLNYSASTRAV
jgi:2-polyprenyl-3-methyl-5-hydroxy-6-metoxy-1,4-benzoquinol methylase